MLSLVAPTLLALAATVGAKDCDLETDILVVGGGSTGTYAAVKLHDLGKTVLVVEKSNVLGGHVNTYTDPDTETVLNVGAQLFHDTTIVRDYFARLGVEPISMAGSSGDDSGDSGDIAAVVQADVQLGIATNYTEPSGAELGAALLNYIAFINSTAPDMDLGWDHIGFPVHEDLLAPFHETAKKYNFEAAIHTINSFNQPGYATDEPTIYAAKVFGPELAQLILTSSLVTTHDVEDLYRAAANVLGGSVLFESRLTQVRRSADGVHAVVETPAGRKTIKAKRILNTAYPLLENLAGWDLSAEEQRLFGKFQAHSYFAGVARTSALAEGASLENIGSRDPYGVPAMPGMYYLRATSLGDKLLVYYGANTVISTAEAQANLHADMARLEANGVLPASDLEFLAWYDHTPTRLYAAAEDVRDGLYRDLAALQGGNSTWWSGAAWQAQDSSLLWEFTSRLVDRMLA